MGIHDERRVVWGWAEAEDSDGWVYAGATREEAIAFAHANRDGAEGYGFIAEGRRLSPGGAAAEVVELEEILDRLAELEECMAFDEPPFETSGDKAEAEAALKEAIRAWGEEHLTANDRWTLTGEAEPVPPPAPGQGQ